MAGLAKVGIIGTGNILTQYVKGIRSFAFLDLVACADIDRNKAQARAKEFGIPRDCAVDELLAEPGLDIVLNLTVPTAHSEVSLAAIQSGKHVYSEKPLAVTPQDGRRVLDAARAASVVVGCAPDTFLGGGQQTCRKLIDDGWIGEPVAAVAFMVGHGPESWHPNPDFFYQRGAGPMLDVGVYYVTSLVNLLGPVRRVTGSARISFPERVATSQQHWGRRIPVEVPTHVAGVIDFAAGPIGTIITSFDTWASHLPRIEVYGSEGTLCAPDPNIFGGQVFVRRAGASDWTEMPLTHSAEVERGIGVADMALAIAQGRAPRASATLAYHVLEVMAGCQEASDSGRHVEIASRCARPEPLPMGLLKGELAK
jgi:predicted dehydrogenase